MKQLKLKYGFVIGAVCLSIGLSGCLTIPNSPTPRYYALSAVDGSQVNKKINLVPGTIVGVGPVKIPEFQDRPQIVTRTKDKMIQFAQFDRWGESLDLGLARLIREDLTVMLPGTKLTLYPWNPSIAVKYQVSIEVIQLDSELDRDMNFVVQWTVTDMQNYKTVIIKRSVFRQAILPQNYLGIAATLSADCVSLSDQIAEALATLKVIKIAPKV